MPSSRQKKNKSQSQKRQRSTGSVSTRSPSYKRIEAPTSASVLYKSPTGGIGDMRNLPLSYVPGISRMGNGTFGTLNSIYMCDPTNTLLSTGVVPIAPADAVWGQSYCADLFKHFTRVVFNKIKIRSNPCAAGSNTNQTVSLAGAPIRGYDYVPSTKSDSSAAPISGQGVLSMRGAQQFPPWAPVEWDLTPYIAGGTGHNGREFNVGNSVASTSEHGAVNSLEIPCGFLLSGDSTGSAISGALSDFIVDCVVDLLDFVGSWATSNPERDEAWEHRRHREKDGLRHVEKCAYCSGLSRRTPRRTATLSLTTDDPTSSLPVGKEAQAVVAQMQLQRQTAVDTPSGYVVVAAPTPSFATSVVPAAAPQANAPTLQLRRCPP